MMFHRGFLSAVMLGAVALASPVISTADELGRIAVEQSPKRKARAVHRLGFGAARRRLRGKGPAAKPKRKSNRVTIGRRVRRAHRRAA